MSDDDNRAIDLELQDKERADTMNAIVDEQIGTLDEERSRAGWTTWDAWGWRVRRAAMSPPPPIAQTLRGRFLRLIKGNRP